MSWGRAAQQAIMWALLFLGVIAVYGLWEDIRGTVAPQQSVEAGRITLPRMPDGHYYLTANVNGAQMRFMVDTGATAVVLTPEAARQAGFAMGDLSFTAQAQTANGIVRTAPVVLDNIAVSGVTHRGVRALVNEAPIPESLLGMSYLQRFSRIEITNGALILEP